MTSCRRLGIDEECVAARESPEIWRAVQSASSCLCLEVALSELKSIEAEGSQLVPGPDILPWILRSLVLREVRSFIYLHVPVKIVKLQ